MPFPPPLTQTDTLGTSFLFIQQKECQALFKLLPMRDN